MDEITLLHAAQDAVRRRPPVKPEKGGTQIVFPYVAEIMARMGHPAKSGAHWRKTHSAAAKKGLPAPESIPEVEEIATELLGAPIGASASSAPLVEFPKLIDPPAPGWSGDYLDAIIKAQEEMDKHETEQTKVPIVLPENLPYGVVFSGDWHIGGRGVDHKLLRSYFDLWRRTPGLRVVGMGDYTEMFSGKLAGIGVKEHVMPPDMQIAAAVDQITTELSDCLIALLKGNHDNWAGNYANYVQLLAQRIRPKGKDKPGIAYLGIGGEIMLTVGQTEYRIAAWHRYAGASAINKGNNQRRVSVDHNGPDVVALAHLHNQYGELSRNGEVDQVRCRSGAMKIRDEHSRDFAGNITPDVRMPMVIFHPGRKAMRYFDDFRDGIEPLLYYRSRWSRRPDWSTDSKHLDELLAEYAKPA